MRSTRAQWLVPASLVALSLVPTIMGSIRVAEVAGGAAVTPENARFLASPVPVLLHVPTAGGRAEGRFTGIDNSNSAHHGGWAYVVARRDGSMRVMMPWEGYPRRERAQIQRVLDSDIEAARDKHKDAADKLAVFRQDGSFVREWEVPDPTEVTVRDGRVVVAGGYFYQQPDIGLAPAGVVLAGRRLDGDDGPARPELVLVVRRLLLGDAHADEGQGHEQGQDHRDVHRQVAAKALSELGVDVTQLHGSGALFGARGSGGPGGRISAGSRRRPGPGRGSRGRGRAR